jgi:ribosomal protein S18 acetylase RimI-like enzyme
MRIRTAELQDLMQIVDVHIDAFPNFFLTSLGRGFLKSYYRIYIQYGHIAYVADNNGIIVGFVVGTHDSRKFYNDLRKESQSFILPLLMNFYNLALIRKVLKRVKSVFFRKKVNENVKDYVGFNELTSIGVATQIKARGIGSSLLHAYEDFCMKSQCKGIVLTTDAVDNEHVLKFYQKFGYSIDQTFEQDNKRKMYSLIKYL